MDWLNPDTVREWLGHQGKLSQIEVSFAFEQFGLAVADDPTPTGSNKQWLLSPAGVNWCIWRWSMYREVARLIRDAQDGTI